jgi:hypothetical protein
VEQDFQRLERVTPSTWTTRQNRRDDGDQYGQAEQDGG